MGDYMLPASPNWYCGRVSDCSGDGLFMFGAKNCLYLLDVSRRPARYRGRVSVHPDVTERVVGVSVCRGGEAGGRAREAGGDLRVATASEDGRVRVWALPRVDGEVKANAATVLDEHANHKNRPTAVHWSSHDPDIVASGDEKGGLVVWRLARQEVKQFTLENSSVFTLECSPHNSFHLAVGYKSGLVLVIDISGHGVVLHRLRGHDEEVHCVSWCPTLGEDIRQRTEWDDPAPDEDRQPGGCLLASGSRDRTLRLWSLSKGRCLLSLKVGGQGMPGYRRDRHDNNQKVRLWLTLQWHRGMLHHIITSSQTGELLMWDLRRPGKQKCDVLVPCGTTKGHQRIVFNICTGSSDGNRLVTISMDRQVLVWELSTMEVETLPTLGGFAYCLTQSPVNPGRLAVGVGDNMIRVWNTDNPNIPYDVSVLWQGIKAKVTALNWHPTREGLLAYGTDDGRVGIYDVLSNRSPLISETYHKKTVYVVTWGPACNHDNQGVGDQWMVYSCGDGVILRHDPAHLDYTAKVLDKLINTKSQTQGRSAARTEISWKPDFTAVALGNEDGSIDVYRTPSFQPLCVIHIHRKLINIIRWHPQYTGATTQPSPCQYWLASGSNDQVVQVCDLTSCFVSPVTKEVAMVTRSCCSLEGHSNRITGLAWSWNEDGKLLSASYDHTAQVWDVKSGGVPVANYRGHGGRLLSVAWSHSDPDMIYSGGDDFTVQTWKISAQTHTAPPKGAERKKQKKNKSRSKVKEADTGIGTEPVGGRGSVEVDVAMVTGNDLNELQALLAEKKRQLCAAQSLPEAQTEGAVQRPPSVTSQEVPEVSVDTIYQPDVDDIARTPSPEPLKKQIRDHKKRRMKSMFPVFSSMENRGKVALLEDCSNLVKVLYADEDGSTAGVDSRRHLGMYSGRRDMYALLHHESQHHEDHANTEQQTLIDMWTGDIGVTLQKAAERGRLNDWLMALAPQVSPSRWRHLCGVYAKQLETEGNIHKSATYLLTGGNIQQAIDLLRRHHLYREAISLARVRLSPHDPLIVDLYTDWADHLAKECSFEQAAKCYLAVRQPLEAAKTLARRVDPLALKTAVHITLVANEMTACEAYGLKYMQDCELKGDWASAAELADWHDIFKAEGLVVKVHEILVRELSKLDLYQGHDLEDCVTSLDRKPTKSSQDIPLVLPKFLLNPEKADPMVVWEPVLVGGEAMVLAIIRSWLLTCHLDLCAEPLKVIYLELSRRKQTAQHHAMEKQVVLDVSLDVTLGVLSLLQCNTEMAAYWWVVAMATCHDASHFKLLQGLCRLLLPQGPCSLTRLQRQVTAVRMATVDNHMGTVPAPSNKPILPLPDVIVSQSPSRQKKRQVSNSGRHCTEMNCLTAFYCRTVLNDLTLRSRSDEGDRGQSVVGVERCTDTQLSPVTMATSGKVEQEPAGKGRSESSSALDGHQMAVLSVGVLWNVQVLKNHLRAALENIERAAKSNHWILSASEGDIDHSDVIPNQSGLLSCCSLPNIVRSPSGEYLYMKPGGATEPSPENPEGKCSFTIGADSDSDDDDDDVLDTGEDEPIDIAKVKFASHTPRRRCVRSQSVDIVSPTAGFSPLLLRFGKNTESDDTAEGKVGEMTLQDIPEVKEVKYEDDVETAAEAAEKLPEDWEDMPVDERYKIKGVSLSVLSNERKKRSLQLLKLSSSVVSCPFPDPLESARKLLQLHGLTPEGVPFCHQVALWAKGQAYLATDRQYFAAKVEELGNISGQGGRP